MEGVSGGSEPEIRFYSFLPRSISGAVFGTLTILFVSVAGLAGAITGALAGRGSDCGAFRGAGLGALSAAVLSVEILDAFCRQGLFDRRNPSLADFMEELLHGRVSELQFLPNVLKAEHLRESVGPFDVLDLNRVAYKGLSKESLRRLPSHQITNETKPARSNCCPICLQDIGVGEIARSLPHCQHMFHTTCVDKWLTRHGSCSICRQHV